MITVLVFNAADQARAERLCDAIYWCGGQKPIGHALVCAGSDVHAECKRKVTIAAQVAFSSAELLELTPVTGTKTQQINSVFSQVSKYVQECYREPWLYLEADCVPLKPTWLTDLFTAYHNQPKRYFGRHMAGKTDRFMARMGIYPHDAHSDMAGACASPNPFERVAQILPRTTNSGLFHMEKWKEGLVLPATALLLNGDRSGQLIEQLIETAPVTTEVTLAKRRGRPPNKIPAV